MSQPVALTESADGGKRGELYGGALSDEALDSLRSVLQAHRELRPRGLQQFFSLPGLRS